MSSQATSNTIASLRRSLRGSLAPLAGLVVVAIGFTVYGFIAKPDVPFLSAFRLALVAKQAAIVGAAALGMTAVIASGGIDLSIGSLTALASVVLALSLRGGIGAPLALALTAAVGIVAGLLNGAIVVFLRVTPFVATLGTMLVLRGVAEHASSEQKIAADAPLWLGQLLDPPGVSGSFLVSGGVWLVLAAALVTAFVLARTVFGRHVFAIGSSEPTARLCGVDVSRVKLAVYALAGLFGAFAGTLEFANLNRQGSPTSGVGLELAVIAAVVLGGASLSGGRGSILGSLLGALLMSLLSSGCIYAELADPLQKLVVGAIIVGAVALDARRRAH